MRHLTVLLVFSLKFTNVKMKGPNKSIQPQPQKIIIQTQEQLPLILHKKTFEVFSKFAQKLGDDKSNPS